jgi:hypothetical protein
LLIPPPPTGYMLRLILWSSASQQLQFTSKYQVRQWTFLDVHSACWSCNIQYIARAISLSFTLDLVNSYEFLDLVLKEIVLLNHWISVSKVKAKYYCWW